MLLAPLLQLLLAPSGVLSQAHDFNLTRAQICVSLCAATFCDKSTYQTRTFTGLTSGFIVTDVIDSLLDAQGFVGILPSDSAIYIAFEGSHSSMNTFEDIDAWKVDYTSNPACNCKVDKGFYMAEQSVLEHVERSVRRLLAAYPDYDVVVTGISFGAAVAQLISVDLAARGLPNQMINFGQPRTGDPEYSAFANALVPDAWRVVHYQDPVPHAPGLLMGYYHTCHEVYEDVDGSVRVCDDSCEDPTCADQWSLKETNSEDHMTYLGIYMSCGSV